MAQGSFDKITFATNPEIAVSFPHSQFIMSTPAATAQPSSMGQFRQQIQQQSRMQALQHVMEQMTEVCFNQCVETAHGPLTGSQTSCLMKCSDKFIAAHASVYGAFQEKMSTYSFHLFFLVFDLLFGWSLLCCFAVVFPPFPMHLVSSY